METGQDKVKEICDLLKRETIDPAKKEGEEIVKHAQDQAHQIVEEARRKTEKLGQEAKTRIEEERNVFQASLNLAAKQTILNLKQEVEEALFNKELTLAFQSEMQKPEVIAELINAVVGAIEKEGIEGDLEAVIPSVVTKEKVAKLIKAQVMERLKGKAVTLGDMTGGAQVKLVNKEMTLDISDESLRTLLANFMRDDFRTIIFSS